VINEWRLYRFYSFSVYPFTDYPVFNNHSIIRFAGSADEQGPLGTRLEDQVQLVVHRSREVPLLQEKLPRCLPCHQTLKGKKLDRFTYMKKHLSYYKMIPANANIYRDFVNG
jgi:hypothetical protein